MDASEGVGDLHLHTTASDGTCSVADRIEQAAVRGLDAIAVTDHDCFAADVDRRSRTSDGVEVIAGVEVRGDVRDTKVELLGYYVDPADAELRNVLQRARRFRRERNRELVSRLNQSTLLDLEYDRLAERAEGTLGRPHLASTLVEEGIVDSIGEAFDRYLGENGAAFVPMRRVSASTVLDAVHGAGGVASLAHPGRIRSAEVPRIVADLRETGLDGIEVWYPYDRASDGAYPDVDVEEAASLASEHDLLQTGGSDCHGPGSGNFRIGDVQVPEEQVVALRNRAERRRSL